MERNAMVTKRKVDVSIEKEILIGMIVNSKFIKGLLPIYKSEYFSAPFARTVADWCIGYAKKYDKAPKKSIQSLFHVHSAKDEDEDKVELIHDFLSTLSEEFVKAKKMNVAYLLDRAEAYFKKRSLEILSKNLLGTLVEEGSEEAEKLVREYKQVARPTSSGINPFNNPDALREAFEEEGQRLISFPDALGELLNDELVREGFVGMMAAEKKGKTWLAVECATRAMRSRCNVAFFETGDMSERRLVRRFAMRITRKPTMQKYCGTVYIPVLDCQHNQDGSCKHPRRSGKGSVPPIDEEGDEPITPELLMSGASKNYLPCCRCMKRDKKVYRGAVWYKKKRIDEPLTWRESFQIGNKFMKQARGKDFKLIIKPTNTYSVNDIRNQLDTWEQSEGFIPDVIIIDYADILGPMDKKKDYRQQQNETWSAMRALSLEKHALVLTFTQANQKSYKARSLQLGHVGEDKRKYAHVTLMGSINQVPKEKRLGIWRFGVLVMREDFFTVDSEVCVLQNLSIGSPYLGSYWSYQRKEES
jgi:hypothetical protein